MNLDTAFPVKITASEDSVKNKYLRHYNRLSSDSLYHFSLVLSKKWEITDRANHLAINTGSVSLAHYTNSSLPHSQVAVSVYVLSKEVHPCDFVKILLQNQSGLISTSRAFVVPFGIIADYLSENTSGNETVISRSVGIKDGNRLYLLQCSCEKGSYTKEVAEDFLIAVATFDLLNATNEFFAEKMKTYYFGKQTPVPIQFSFPHSWLYEPDKALPESGNTFCLQNKNEQQDVVGNVLFCAVPQNAFLNASDFIYSYLDRLQMNGANVEKKQLVKESTDYYDAVWTIMTNGVVENVISEISAVVIAEKKAFVLAMLISPSEETDIEAWAMNRRAFNILLESLKIGEKKWEFIKR